MNKMEADVVEHIRECDMEYYRAYHRRDRKPMSNLCRKFLMLGHEITSSNLPLICMRHCDRWRTPG